MGKDLEELRESGILLDLEEGSDIGIPNRQVRTLVSLLILFSSHNFGYINA